jgi:uncharacterized membrane protein
MKHGGTKYHVTTLAAAVFGLVCLPCILAPLLISAGLSSILLLVGTWFTPLLIGLIGLSLIGFFLSYRGHKNWLPLVLAAGAGVAVYDSRYVSYNQTLAYVAVVALLGAIGFDWWIRRRTANCAGLR